MLAVYYSNLWWLQEWKCPISVGGGWILSNFKELPWSFFLKTNILTYSCELYSKEKKKHSWSSVDPRFSMTGILYPLRSNSLSLTGFMYCPAPSISSAVHFTIFYLQFWFLLDHYIKFRLEDFFHLNFGCEKNKIQQVGIINNHNLTNFATNKINTKKSKKTYLRKKWNR